MSDGCGCGCTPGQRRPRDPALLERVVGNLVENAVRHNVEGGWLEVGTEVGADGWARLRVPQRRAGHLGQRKW